MSLHVAVAVYQMPFDQEIESNDALSCYCRRVAQQIRSDKTIKSHAAVFEWRKHKFYGRSMRDGILRHMKIEHARNALCIETRKFLASVNFAEGSLYDLHHAVQKACIELRSIAVQMTVMR